MDIELKDVYQLLISECRYGYTRNNHLMPDGAYDKVKKYIPEMYKIDEEYALYTLQQICEECISENLLTNFYDGYDDELGNRQRCIDFINARPVSKRFVCQRDTVRFVLPVQSAGKNL